MILGGFLSNDSNHSVTLSRSNRINPWIFWQGIFP